LREYLQKDFVLTDIIVVVSAEGWFEDSLEIRIIKNNLNQKQAN